MELLASLFDFHGYGPGIFKGAILTIEIAFLSLLLSLLLGLLGATAKLSQNRFARGLATTYTTIIRGVPDLVLMLLLFYGGQLLINDFTDWLYDKFGTDIFIEIDQFTAGVISIGFIFGAYMTETFRGAFLAINQGELEAGKAYGMTRWQLFQRISFPLMMRHALPGLGNNWQVMLKTTALVSVIGLEDMVRLASMASKSVHEPFKFFIPVVLVYLALTSLSEWTFKRMQKHYNTGVVTS